MYLPNEILNIIFSYVERPRYHYILKEIIKNYDNFISKKSTSNIPSSQPAFHVFFFKLFIPIWNRWPENYLLLKNLAVN